MCVYIFSLRQRRHRDVKKLSKMMLGRNDFMRDLSIPLKKLVASICCLGMACNVNPGVKSTMV